MNLTKAEELKALSTKAYSRFTNPNDPIISNVPIPMSALIGVKVISAEINDSNDRIKLVTDAGVLYFSWIGDCCSHCFLAHVSGSEELTGGTILEIETKEWVVLTDIDGTDETMGTRIKTDKGYVDLESRLEHNGYYSGEIFINVNPVDKYENTETCDEPFKPLKDF